MITLPDGTALPPLPTLQEAQAMLERLRKARAARARASAIGKRTTRRQRSKPPNPAPAYDLVRVCEALGTGRAVLVTGTDGRRELGFLSGYDDNHVAITHVRWFPGIVYSTTTAFSRTTGLESASNPVLRIEIADGWPIPLPAPSESP